ncbi:MAG: DUF4160 domain-containing protein [Solirubrobacteraceae bacterium]
MIVIATGEIIRGALPQRALRMVREWASIHRDEDRAIFEAVAVGREFGTVVWPGDVDLDPDVLRGDQTPATAPAPPRLVIQTA